VDQEVAKTLGDLELKLAQLERELMSVGRREAPAEDASEQAELTTRRTGTAGKLIDEAVEQSDYNSQSGPADGRPSIPVPFSPGPVFERVEPPSPPHSPAVETHPRTWPPAPSHQPPAEQRQSIDIADLVRFRDKLARTMDELIAEYSRLLSLQPPGSSRPPDA
jgi:hypothetical protein